MLSINNSLDIEQLAMDYYKARGLPVGTWSTSPRGTKFSEESQELIDAIDAYNEYLSTPTLSPDVISDLYQDISDEIADVLITLSWIARCYNIDFKEAILSKTEKDRGRAAKDNITT